MFFRYGYYRLCFGQGCYNKGYGLKPGNPAWKLPLAENLNLGLAMLIKKYFFRINNEKALCKGLSHKRLVMYSLTPPWVGNPQFGQINTLLIPGIRNNRLKNIITNNRPKSGRISGLGLCAGFCATLKGPAADVFFIGQDQQAEYIVGRRVY